MGNSVILKTFMYRHEAEMAKGLLEDNSIEAIISADDMGGYRPHLSLSMGNVRLLVRSQDFERARDILKVLDHPAEDAQPEGD